MIVHLEHIIHHDHKYINNSLNGLFAYFSENQDKNVFRYDKKKRTQNTQTGWKYVGISIGMLNYWGRISWEIPQKFSPIDLSIVSETMQIFNQRKYYFSNAGQRLVVTVVLKSKRCESKWLSVGWKESNEIVFCSYF